MSVGQGRVEEVGPQSVATGGVGQARHQVPPHTPDGPRPTGTVAGRQVREVVALMVEGPRGRPRPRSPVGNLVPPRRKGDPVVWVVVGRAFVVDRQAPSTALTTSTVGTGRGSTKTGSAWSRTGTRRSTDDFGNDVRLPEPYRRHPRPLTASGSAEVPFVTPFYSVARSVGEVYHVLGDRRRSRGED